MTHLWLVRTTPIPPPSYDPLNADHLVVNMVILCSICSSHNPTILLKEGLDRTRADLRFGIWRGDPQKIQQKSNTEAPFRRYDWSTSRVWHQGYSFAKKYINTTGISSFFAEKKLSLVLWTREFWMWSNNYYVFQVGLSYHGVCGWVEALFISHQRTLSDSLRKKKLNVCCI